MRFLGIRALLVALVLQRHENQVKDKHVESTLVPRLDEGSIPSSSTRKADMACETKKNIRVRNELGCFLFFY